MEPIPVKHSEPVVFTSQPAPVVQPPTLQPKKEKKKKAPVEQDASVFLTGMADDQEMEEDEDDEDVFIQSVNNDR
jgi:hypothetical protein